MDDFAISSSWRFLNWLPRFLLRRFFPPSWLAENTKIDITRRGDRFTIYGGELPSVVLWLDVVNNPHFRTVMDRLVVHLACNLAPVMLLHLDRTDFQPGETKKMYLSTGLTSQQLDYLVRATKHSSPHFQVKAEFNCKVGNYAVATRDLDGVKPNLVNIPND